MYADIYMPNWPRKITLAVQVDGTKESREQKIRGGSEDAVHLKHINLIWRVVGAWGKNK